MVHARRRLTAASEKGKWGACVVPGSGGPRRPVDARARAWGGRLRGGALGGRLRARSAARGGPAGRWRAGELAPPLAVCLALAHLSALVPRP